MDAMQVENINWLVPPPPPPAAAAAAAKDVAAADANPVFAPPWPDPYADMLDMGPLDPSFTASLEDSIVDPNLLGGFEDEAAAAGKAVNVEPGAQHAPGQVVDELVSNGLSTDTSPDLDFFSSDISHPSTSSNRSSSLITPDSLPPALPTPPPAPSQGSRKRGRPQKRQSLSSSSQSSTSQQQQQQQQQQQEEDKSPAKRKRRSPQSKPAPATEQQQQPQPPIVHPDLVAATTISSSSSSSAIAISGPSSSTGMAEIPEIPEGASTPPAAQSKRSRIREKNRIAACKCRRKQRKAVSKLTSTHEGLEDLNRQLCGQVSELEAEAYMLKNMLMAHGNCGCEMIQQYFKDAAASLVQKVDTEIGGPSASGSGRRTGDAMRAAEV